MKKKDQSPIVVDSTTRTKTRDTVRPVVSRIEQLPVDAATQHYADVIAQVRERMTQDAKKKRG